MVSSPDDLSGYWLAEMYAEHLPEDLAFDEGLIKSVIQSCQPGNALDLGCGAGYFVRWLRAWRGCLGGRAFRFTGCI
jgi:predicted TPR repeat methyltransferase